FRETLGAIRQLESTPDDGHEPELQFCHPDRDQNQRKWLENLFRPENSKKSPSDLISPPPDHIQVIAAPGRYAEADHIGRLIHSLLKEGIPSERIGVCVHDLGLYGQLFDDVFRRLGLPLFFRRGAPLLIQAPVRALMALFRLADSHWERDLVLDLLASPYLDLGFGLSWTRAAELSSPAGITDDLAGGG
ncbi:MAG: hypothetical protein HQK55_14440, partial [Deltaproteobacteria bacterium]|nr:hypothetical protein [Deltaproteobacteria bacterium]